MEDPAVKLIVAGILREAGDVAGEAVVEECQFFWRRLSSGSLHVKNLVKNVKITFLVQRAATRANGSGRRHSQRRRRNEHEILEIEELTEKHWSKDKLSLQERYEASVRWINQWKKKVWHRMRTLGVPRLPQTWSWMESAFALESKILLRTKSFCSMTGIRM